MARLSVYIPDELLELARGTGSAGSSDGENTSQLIQRGLQSLVDSQERAPSYARMPGDAVDRIAEQRDRLLREAQHDYEVGYSGAIAAASEMSLHVINALVDDNFDLRKWLQPFRGGYEHELMAHMKPAKEPPSVEALLHQTTVSVDGPATSGEEAAINKDGSGWEEWWRWMFKTAEVLGTLADPIGFDRYSFSPTKARERGFTDAMRELWAAIEQPDQDTEHGSRTEDEPGLDQRGGK